MLPHLPARTLCRGLALLPLLVSGPGSPRSVQSEGAVEPLRFGSSSALSGPTSDLGKKVSTGVRAAFREANENGGIRGRPLELVLLDDGYEPHRTVPNVRRLLDEERVLAIVGNVGTPTAVAAIPLTNAAETVFFGAFTGAGVLRKSPPDPWVVNFRSSYAEEMAAMVDALVDEAGIAPERIALFTQRDAYGDAGFAGARAALLRRGSSQEHRVLHVRYERNTENVEGALAEILLLPEPPRAVILVGAYRPCAKFVRLAKELGLDAVFLNVSFVGVESFLEQAGEAAEGVIVTQVVPHPLSDRPGVQSYRAALAAEAPDAEPSYASLEGYQVGRVLCLALERWDGPLDRAGVRAALLALGTFDLGLGFDLTLSEQSLQASHRVLATRIEGGKVVELDWSELRALRVENP